MNWRKRVCGWERARKMCSGDIWRKVPSWRRKMLMEKRKIVRFGCGLGKRGGGR